MNWIDIEDSTPKKLGEYKVLIKNVSNGSREGIAVWGGLSFELKDSVLGDEEFIWKWC